ncbi:Oxygen tolerance [Salinimicrobium catena]|uniref:Oxygen tolerance n=1 Tax=Salinimicrobium catena TaxID=390640 RepID=A0A1H5J202_9FLAO|nr:BatD family protein [Salinimicrobium catena]SDK83184.1 Oxygen tolerance [Salinimicrobium catena]SEE46470.1 Oxygen tolerance [Salinimicrobium catena]
MKSKFIFLAFLMITGFACAQVQFEAKASKTKLGVNERLRIDFTMNEDGDNFNPPSFSNFTVVGGPNQSVSNSWINGKRSYSKTYSYFLAPKKRGNFTIGQAEITIEGNVYKTTPVDIEVTAAVDEPTDGNNSEYIASENLHLVAEISNTNPYLNEAITVVYKLYVSPRINVSDWRQIDNPKFSDFWSQNIDMQRLQVENGEYKGEPYRYVVLRKTVLYPQKTGKLDIEPLTLSVSVDVPGDRRDIFGNRFYETVDKTVAAGNRTINVKPLPAEGKPAGFTGAVGRNLSFRVTADKQELNATESLQAKVQVSGQGNLKLFDLPTLTVPASVEKYEPEYVEDVTTNLNGMQGSISNTYTLVPQAKGKYPIPPVSFSYFDLKSETYRTLTSDEILLNVNAAPAGQIAGASGSSNVVTQQVPSAASQFRYIKLNSDLTPIGQTPFIRSVLFWSLFALPLLLIPVAIFFGKRREAIAGDVKGNRIKKADRLARKYLSEAKRNLGDQKKFYESLERALHNYLKAKLHIQTSEMSKERIRELLSTRRVDANTVTQFIKLLESCEFARYTPASNVAMRQDYDKAVEVISEIDKQV